jgi:hypothetical protein
VIDRCTNDFLAWNEKDRMGLDWTGLDIMGGTGSERYQLNIIIPLSTLICLSEKMKMTVSHDIVVEVSF